MQIKIPEKQIILVSNGCMIRKIKKEKGEESTSDVIVHSSAFICI
jgi:hypothetical protein